MPKIVSVHSFRGGTGKSNITANLAACVARSGKRVGIVDTDIQSPGIHILFGLKEDDIGSCLNDFLWGRAKIEDTAHDVTAAALGTSGRDSGGRVFLVPSSIKTGEIARILREGYDVRVLNGAFQDILERLSLEFLFIDTHPGLNEETLLSIAISDALLIILRPDQQDYLGTSVTVEVARKLNVPNLNLIVNKVPVFFDQDQVKTGVEQAYNARVAGVLTHSDEMMALGSVDLFTRQFPEHPNTAVLQAIAAMLMQEE